MNKRIKIYIILIILLALIAFEKVGIYDASYIKVDNFIIKKPFLYRNFVDKFNITLNNHDSTCFIFVSVFTHNAALYTFRKVTDKKTFVGESEYSLKMNTFDTSKCYVLTKDMQLTSKVLKENYIYSYPYVLSFNEINSEREEEMIQQMCKDNVIVFLNTVMQR